MKPHVTLVYDPENGSPCRDGHIEDFYKGTLLVSGDQKTIGLVTGTYGVVLRFRIAARDGDITLDLVYGDRTYPVDGSGMMNDFSGWPDIGLDLLERLLW